MSRFLDRAMTSAVAVSSTMMLVRFGGWSARDVQIVAMLIAVIALVLSIALAVFQKKSQVDHA